MATKPVSKQNITDRKLSWGERLQLYLIPLAIATLQRLQGLTSRVTVLGAEHIEGLRSEGRPWIYAIWHTNVLYSPYLLRNQGVAVMISSSKDGELITRVVRRFGNTAIRGSTSRGGVAALKSLVKHLAGGTPAAITPDGPRGPAFELQAGIVTAAQVTGVPIVPFHYECTRQWIAEKAWDQHRIPKPFTRFVLSYGEPVHVPKDLDAEEFEQTVADVERRLLQNTERCREQAASLRGS